MLSFNEIALLLLVAVLVWHAKIPKAASKIGSAIGQFKKSLDPDPVDSQPTTGPQAPSAKTETPTIQVSESIPPKSLPPPGSQPHKSQDVGVKNEGS